MKTSTIFLVAVIAGLVGVVLVLVQQRLSQEAFAVILGSVCGITASIPVMLYLALLQMRFNRTPTRTVPRRQVYDPDADRWYELPSGQ